MNPWYVIKRMRGNQDAAFAVLLTILPNLRILELTSWHSPLTEKTLSSIIRHSITAGSFHALAKLSKFQMANPCEHDYGS